MTFRSANQKYLIPAAQSFMIFGIIALCQPWIEPLHRYGLTITLIGLIGFSVFTKFGPDTPPPGDED
jgi:hypothetical protein